MKQPQRVQQATPHGAALVPDQATVLDTVVGSDAFLHLVWDSAPDAMMLSDGDGVVLMANAAYCRLYGYEVEEIVGHSFAIIFPPEQRTRAIERYRAVYAGAGDTS